MIVKKNTYYHYKVGTQPFMTLSGRNLNLSSIVRDWILPNRFVQIEITDSGDLIFTPSDSPSDYTVCLSGNQAKIGVCALLNPVKLNPGKRMPCKMIENGAILCQTE